MQTLINISESILKIEMGTMKITIEVNDPIPGVMAEILESKTPIISEASTPNSDDTSEKKPKKTSVKKTPKITTKKKKPHKQNRVAVSKKCQYCNMPFTPTINAQKFCNPDCRELNKQKQLDATLKEIEDNRSAPYEFAKRM